MRVISFAALTLFVAACSSDNTAPPTVTTVNVSLSAATVQAGQTTTATAAALDQNGAPIVGGAVAWSTGSAAIATVDASNGTVTGVAPGTTQIIATIGGKSGERAITVVAAPAVLATLSAAAPITTLALGQTTTATAVGIDQYRNTIATGAVTWSSATPTVATVNATTGVVTGISAGTSVISATAAGKTGTFVVTVSSPPAIRINEVESNGGTPGDWVELYNAGATAVDVSGWGFRDNDTTHTIYKLPSGTTIAAGAYLLVEEAAFGFGLGAPDEARLYNQFGATVDVYSWTAHALTTYGRCPSGAGAFVTTTASTKGAANDCRPLVRVNEVESNGGTPGDWIEFYNAGPTTVNLAGFVVKDNDDTHSAVLPAGASIAAGGYYVVEEATLGYGLGSADAARLFDPNGVLVDTYEWTAHATITYGRCPDGTGVFAQTATSTKGASNDCGSTGPAPASPWPGTDNVTTVDGVGVFGSNLSGLMYETAKGASPAVLWGAKNGPGSMYRLILSGGIWTPDPANDWATGKRLTYPDGTGEPDAEGITFTSGGSLAGIYVSAERNNQNNSVSRNSVLRFDPAQAGTTLKATNEWNLTADLPVTGANLGAEAIAWIPDSVLVAKKFYDEKAARTYNPADYADHGNGIFFVGLEANGNVYAYALNHVTNGFTRIATFSTGFPTGVMDLNFDPATNYLWAECDDGCGGTLGIFEIDGNPTSPTFGRFLPPRVYARPTSMPNINNEGFTVTTQAECVANWKPAFWSDDSETGGHSIRTASIPCGVIAPLFAPVRSAPRATRAAGTAIRH